MLSPSWLNALVSHWWTKSCWWTVHSTCSWPACSAQVVFEDEAARPASGPFSAQQMCTGPLRLKIADEAAAFDGDDLTAEVATARAAAAPPPEKVGTGAGGTPGSFQLHLWNIHL
jgi:hypothetical protein